jgi:protein TonB
MNINQEANMDTMEHLEPRHFALPAAFVLTLLAFFLFGITRPPMPATPVVPVKLPLTKRDEIEIKIYDPPPPVDIADSDPSAKPVDAGSGPLRPTLLDDLQIVGPRSFVVAVEPPSPQPQGPIDKIGPGGPFPGTSDGPGIGRHRTVSWKELDQPPRVRSQASPVYPVQEKSSGIAGKVEVEFIVDETGAVVNPRVVSSTHRSFEEPTLVAVEKWRFAPGRRLGQVVSFRMSVPVVFNVND